MTDEEFDLVLEKSFLELEIEIFDNESDDSESEEDNSFPMELLQKHFNGNTNIYATLNYN